MEQIKTMGNNLIDKKKNLDELFKSKELTMSKKELDKMFKEIEEDIIE